MESSLKGLARQVAAAGYNADLGNNLHVFLPGKMVGISDRDDGTFAVEETGGRRIDVATTAEVLEFMEEQ